MLMPQEFTIDPAAIQPPSERIIGQEIRFATVAELAPGQQLRFAIPVTPNRTASKIQVRAEMAASSISGIKIADSAPIDILGAP